MPQGEVKIIDTALAAYPCTATGSVTLLSGLATGTDYTGRLGRRIQMMHAEIRGWLIPDDATTNSNLARLLLVLDHQPSGALAAVTDILQASDSTSMYNINNKNRFEILWDQEYAMAATKDVVNQAFAGSPTTWSVNEVIPIRDQATYSGTGATIASVSSNAVLLVSIGTNIATDATNANLTARISYMDC